MAKDAARALDYKTRGNALYARADFCGAIECYSHGLRFLPGPPDDGVAAAGVMAAATAAAAPDTAEHATDAHAPLRSILHFNRAHALVQRAKQLTDAAAERDRDDDDSDSGGTADTTALSQALVGRAMYDCACSLIAAPAYAKARTLRAELFDRIGLASVAKLERALLLPTATGTDAKVAAVLPPTFPAVVVDAKAGAVAPAAAPGNGDASWENPAIANAHRAVTIESTAACGRHLRATKPLGVGDVIVREQPFAAVLNREYRQFDGASRCDWCFRALQSVRGASGRGDSGSGGNSGGGRVLWWECCAQCSGVVYCSARCRSDAWPAQHRFECGHAPFLHSLREPTLLALRVCYRAPDAPGPVAAATAATATAPAAQGAASAKSDARAEVRGPPTRWRGDYADVTSLLSHAGAWPAAVVAEAEAEVDRVVAHFVAAAAATDLAAAVPTATTSTAAPATSSAGAAAAGATATAVADSFTVGCARTGVRVIRRADLLHHTLQTRTNVYAVTRLITTTTGTDAPKRAQQRAGAMAAMEETRQARVAVALYPTASLLNHACAPNTFLSFGGGNSGSSGSGSGRELVIRAAAPIPAGAEVLNCYGPHAGRHPTAERQRLLREQYLFACACVACTGDGVRDFTEFACENPKCDPANGGFYRAASLAGATADVKTQPKQGKAKANKAAAASGGAAGSERLVCAKCGFVCPDVPRLRRFEAKAAEYVARGQQLLAAGKHDDAAQTLDHALQLRCRLFALPNHAIAATYDALGQAYATAAAASGPGGRTTTGAAERAVESVHASVQLLERIFGASTLEVARETAKLARLCVNARKPQLALAAARRALATATALLGVESGGATEAADVRIPALLSAAEVDACDFAADAHVWEPSADAADWRELRAIIARLSGSKQR